MKISTDGVLLGAWTPFAGDGPVWDAGTGTGLIALMAAQRYPASEISAIEIDPEAASEARENFAASPWGSRLTLIEGDMAEVWPQLPPPGLIISNPPYHNEALRSPDGRRAAARHETSLSPVSLVEIAAKALLPGGTLAIIAPYARRDEIEYAAFLRGLTPTHMVPVISREGREPVRILVALVKGVPACRPDTTPVTIRDRENRYTEGYRRLTDDFYTHLS